MSWTTSRKHRIALGAMVIAGCCCGVATAATVRGGNADAMDHWYGRAGGLSGSDIVSEPPAWLKGGQAVDVGYSEALAEWTNMPRKDAKVGPVTDSLGADPSPPPAASSPQPASSQQ